MTLVDIGGHENCEIKKWIVEGKSSYQDQTSVHGQKYNMNAIVLQYYLPKVKF